MELKYDELADAMYIKFSDNNVVKTVETWEDAVLDLDEQWKIVWIEMIWVKSKFAKNNVILESQQKHLEYA